MQFPGGAPPAVGVLFDSAFDRIDDLLALSLLYGLDGKGEMRMTAITVDRPDFAAAQFCDIVKRFYAGSGGFGGFGASFPIGLAGGKGNPAPAYASLLAKTGGDGSPLYKTAMDNFNETADPATVLRNALTASQPHNTIVIAGGPLTTLAKLIALNGCKEMIGLNVRCLALAAGPWTAADAKAAQRVFDEWPTPIYACARELGDALLFPASSIEKDFAWSKAHPVADAYRAFGSMPYDAPTYSMDAALYAIRPKAGYFKLSEPGVFHMNATGFELTASPQGKHQLLLPDPAQAAVALKTLTELASAQPVVRARRGPRTDPNANTPPVKK